MSLHTGEMFEVRPVYDANGWRVGSVVRRVELQPGEALVPLACGAVGAIGAFRMHELADKEGGDANGR